MDEGTGDIKYGALSRYFPDDVYDKMKDTFSTCSDRTGKKIALQILAIIYD